MPNLKRKKIYGTSIGRDFTVLLKIFTEDFSLKILKMKNAVHKITNQGSNGNKVVST